MQNIVKSKITFKYCRRYFCSVQARNLQTAGWKELLGKEDEDENQEPLLPIVKKGQILYCERGEVVSKKRNRQNHLPMRHCFRQ